MSIIVEEDIFEIRNLQIPVRYLTIDAGRSFSCNAGRCGLCCITEKPPKIRRVSFEEFDRCSELILSKRECGIYSKRPDPCKIYPFMVTTTKNHILVSPNFSCPFISNDTPKFGIKEFKNLIKDNSLENMIYDVYRSGLSLYSTLESSVDEVMQIDHAHAHFPPTRDQILQALKKSLNGLLDDPLNHFKRFAPAFTYEVLSACEFVPESFKDEYLKGVWELNKSDILKTVAKACETKSLYIKPNDDGGPSLVSYLAVGDKVEMRDISANKKYIIELGKSENPFYLAEGGKSLLQDYLDLFLKRDYFLGFNRGMFNPFYRSEIMLSNPFFNFKNALGSFIQLIIGGMVLLSRRDRTDTLDTNQIREVMSFADSRGYMMFF